MLFVGIFGYLSFELYVLLQTEYFRVQIEIFLNVCVVHVEGVFLWNRKITITHHFFTGVDHSGLHYGCLTFSDLI